MGILSGPLLLQAETARTEFVFPIFANTTPTRDRCDYWQSRFTVFNPNSGPTVVTFTLFDGTNSAQTGDSFEIRAFAFEGRALATRLSEPFNIAWLKVTATQPIIATVLIQHLEGCPTGTPTISDLRGRLDLQAPVATRRQFIAVESNSDYHTNTGIAIVFPSETPNRTATGRLIHRWIDGRTVSERNITLAANAQLVAFVTELLPEDSLKFSPGSGIVGSIELIFDQDVFVTAIQFGSVLETLEEHLTPGLSVQVR
jgi:hypothetical protein